MAIKGGDLVHVGNQVLLDRVQTGGPGQLNIPQEKIYELGNYKTVGTVLDIPDLSFPIESFDASAELESMLVGKDFATDADGTVYDVSTAMAIDVASQFKKGRSAASPFEIEAGVAIPYLALESLSYRFGVSENAQQSASFKGDSIFYTPGSVYIQEAAGSGADGQTIALDHKAYPYEGDVVAGTRYALAVTTSTGKRLVFGVDYTETVTGTAAAKNVSVVLSDALDAGDKVRVTYSSDTAASYPQVSHAVASATRPAAIRGRNIKVFVDGTDLTDAWTGVQSFTTEFRVTLDRDLEFGNSEVVSQDFDVPTVNGTITLKPRSATELVAKVRQLANVSSETEVVGALQQAVLPIDIVLYSPETGEALKTLHIPDARFTVPGYSGRVQQKLTVDINYDSDTGTLLVYKGARP